MSKIRFISAVAGLVGLALGCQTEGTSRATTEQSSHPGMQRQAESADDGNSSGAVGASLTRVTDRSLVCMVNNQFMGRPQIPVMVQGRTYYGCCEMCKGRLERDPSSRVSVDPVSGKTIDKADAIIARSDDDKTLYFESEQTFAAYTRGPT